MFSGMVYIFGMTIAPLLQHFAIDCSPKDFLGLQPWYQYLQIKAVQVDPSDPSVQVCQVQNFNTLGTNSSFLLIALAVVDDLIRIAGLVAVGFVIYGGIQYVTSQGSPDATSKAQKTIINALVGVVIAILSASIVAFIGNKFAHL